MLGHNINLIKFLLSIHFNIKDRTEENLGKLYLFQLLASKL